MRLSIKICSYAYVFLGGLYIGTPDGWAEDQVGLVGLAVMGVLGFLMVANALLKEELTDD